MKKFFLFMFASALTLGISGCNDDKETPNPDPSQSKLTINTTSYDDWVYVSFENGVVSPPSDFTNDLSWDIAFHRWDVRTNGGKSGIGQGGAYELTGYTSLSGTLPEPDETKVVADDMITTWTSAPNMDGGSLDDREDVPGNTVMTGWVQVNMGTMEYAMKKNVFMVRAADGQFAALLFTSYMDAGGAKGKEVTFEYLYPL